MGHVWNQEGSSGITVGGGQRCQNPLQLGGLGGIVNNGKLVLEKFGHQPTKICSGVKSKNGHVDRQKAANEKRSCQKISFAQVY